MDETPTELSELTPRSSDLAWMSSGSTTQVSHTCGSRGDGSKHKQSSSFGRGHIRSGSAKQAMPLPFLYSSRSRSPTPGVPHSSPPPRSMPYSSVEVIVIGTPDAQDSSIYNV